MSKTLLFSVTRKDFEQQNFSVGGHGGSGKDTSNSGVRLVHRASGAVGEGRETRSAIKNREIAFKKLVGTKRFKDWHKAECARLMRAPATPETDEELLDRVDRMIAEGLKNGDIVVEENV